MQTTNLEKRYWIICLYLRKKINTHLDTCITW